MDPDSWLAIGAIALSLLFAAFASAAEATIRLIARARVRRQIDDGLPKARAVDAFLLHLFDYASTLAVVATLVVLVSVALTILLVVRYLPGSGLPVWLALLVLAVLLIFAQVLPKVAASRAPDRVAATVAGPLQFVTVLISPLVKLFRAAAGLLLSLVGVPRGDGRLLVAEEELGMLRMGGQEGILDETEKEMIHGILAIQNMTAREVMTPRIDIAAVPADTSVRGLVDIAMDQGYSRMPVYDENIDNILGVLYLKDLFPWLKDGKLQAPVTELMRPAYFIPESKRADELLHEMQEREIHMAIVVDEYGGTAGLVTIEDLLEEIVGEIRDEYDRGEEVKIEEIADGEAAFDGTVTVDDVNETLGLRLTSEDVDTIGGLVYDKLGKMPSPGDEVRVDDALIVVLETDGRRIRRVKVSAQRQQNGRAAGAADQESGIQTPG